MRKTKRLRAVARQFGVDPATVRRWVEHARGQRLERVDFSGRPPGPRRAANRTASEVEQMILQVREQLKRHSDLGHFGAATLAEHHQPRAEAPRRAVWLRPPAPPRAAARLVFAGRGPGPGGTGQL